MQEAEVTRVRTLTGSWRMGLIIATKMLIDPDFVLKDPPSTTDNGRP